MSMSNQFIKYFLNGFFSIFKISEVKIKKQQETDIAEYFTIVGRDIKYKFQEIKRKYERE